MTSFMEKLPLWETSPLLRLIVFSRYPRWSSSPVKRVKHPMHCHPFYELGVVMAGECTWKLDRRRHIPLRSGQAVLIKADSNHREEISSDKETELAWLGFDFSGTAPVWAEQVLSLGEDFNEVAASFQTIYREHSSSSPITRRRVNLAIQNVLVLVSRRGGDGGFTPPDEKRVPRNSSLNARQIRSIESSAHYFRHNFQESLSIAQVAAYHSFCPAYFSTLFRRHYRMSPRSFLRKVKIEKAAELLTTSDLTIKEIGARCGFVDAAHLSKAFKPKYRLTPGAFRLRDRC